jgi:hypothetical protein
LENNFCRVFPVWSLSKNFNHFTCDGNWMILLVVFQQNIYMCVNKYRACTSYQYFTWQHTEYIRLLLIYLSSLLSVLMSTVCLLTPVVFITVDR